MSDYLTRAAQRAAPPAMQLRPELPSFFQREKSEPALASEQAAEAPTLRPKPTSEIGTQVSSLREKITTLTQIAVSHGSQSRTGDIGTPRMRVPSLQLRASDAAVPSVIKIAHEPAPAAPVPPPSQIPAAAAEEKRSPAAEIPVATTAPKVARLSTIVPRATARVKNRREASNPPVQHETPPAIHVTIGRVEVRAVQPPSAPARQTSSAPAPRISLDEYLRARNKDAA
jgi:hypothetical protein